MTGRAGARLCQVACSVGLRGRLVALMLLIIVPFVGFQCMSALHHFREHLHRQLAANEQLAQVVGIAFTNYLENLWTTQEAVGTALVVSDAFSADQAETLLTSLLPSYPTIDYMFWTNPSGTIRAAAPGKWRGVSVADREYFKRILDGENEVVSDIIIGKSDGERAFIVARAIRAEGKLKGVVLARVPLRKMNQVLPVANGAVVTLFDTKRGQIYTSAGVRSQSPDRQNWSGVDAPLPRIGWKVWVGQPMQEIRAAAGYTAARSALAGLLVILVAILAAIWGGRWILDPISRLRTAALAISAGDLSARVTPGGAPEVAAATRAFNLMADRVSDLQTQRTKFLQTAAHELRNPMGGIKAMLSMHLWMAEQGRPISEQTMFMGAMEREIDRLSLTLDEILEAFSVQEGNLILKRERLDLAAVIRAAAHSFHAMGSKHHLLLDRLTEGPVWVTGDFTRLEGVLRVLLGNASKYSAAGTEIAVSLTVCGKDARISVSDQGVGIPTDQVVKVFEQFFRANNLSGSDPGGMGLGLYIARGVVLQHGGYIWAESSEGRGSTFYVQLPMHE